MDGARSLVSKGELFLYGPVDSAAWEGEGVRAIDVIHSLSKITGKQLTVRVNSPGGSVTEGIAIYNALRADGRKVTVRVDAIAASIASVIAMAGDEIIMAENATIMIHDPWSVAVGSSDEMRKMADEIDRMKNVILNIYANRTGKDIEEIASLMSAETYMDAVQAVEFGFATSMDAPMKIAASAIDRSTLKRLILNMGEQKESSEQSSPDAGAASAADKQESEMTTENTTAEETPAATEEEVVETVTETVEEAAAPSAEAVKAERDRLKAIVNSVQSANLPPAFAVKLVNDGVSVDKARELIIKEFAKVNDKASGGEIINAVRVERDETVTRNQGMEEALAIQLGASGTPSDNARRYMGYSLVDMAAELTGHRGPTSTMAVRERVLGSAMQNSFTGMHTTSDLPIMLENAMNKALRERYQAQTPTYRLISQQRSYSDFRPHQEVRVGDFPPLQQVLETGEIKAGTFSETRETTSVKSFGVQIGFSRQLLVNDNLGGIQQMLSSRGERIAAQEEEWFWEMVLSNSGNGPNLIETTRAVFNTTDKTKASAGADITPDDFAKAKAEFRKKKSLDGLRLNTTPSILLVGPDMEYAAQKVVAPIGPEVYSNVNPFSGSVQIVVCSQITDNRWYLFCAPSAGSNFVWGLLSGYEAPRYRMDDPFGQQGMRVSLEHDFGCGAMDYRFGYLVPAK